MFQLTSIFMWVGILSNLVIYSTASDDTEYRVYLDKEEMISSEWKVLMTNIMASNIADGFIN